MHIRTMRAVDRFIGIPLCWITGSVFAKSTTPIQHQNVRTILVIKFFGLGSILLSTPFLSRLREEFPSADIYFLSFETNREILTRLPYALRVLTISTSSIVRFLQDTVSVIAALRHSKIDITFDLEFFSKFSTLISSLSRSTWRIGYALPTYWRRSNLTHPVPLDKRTHAVFVFLRQLEHVGFKVNSPIRLIELQATNQERLSMEKKLGLAENGFEVISMNINAGTTSLERRWHPRQFAAVVQKLHSERPTRKFFFIGSQWEHEYVRQVLDTIPEMQDAGKNCAGLLTIGELIALFQRSSFLLTNDSGPMHLAAASGTRVVALFGPESPEFYGPLGSASVVYKHLPCSPCLNIYNAKMFTCPYNARCMSEISSEEVLRAIRLLEEVPASAHG